jgi:hypothetical protein
LFNDATGTQDDGTIFGANGMFLLQILIFNLYWKALIRGGGHGA